MAGYEWHYQDVERLGDDLRQHSDSLPELADDVLYEWAQETRTALKRRGYPPKRPGQTYVRIGMLANKWAARREGRGVAVIFNQAAQKGNTYPSYVIGDDQGRQAWMHKGRWWVANEEIAERVPGLDRKFDARLAEDFD